jgi:hypothetical protein
MIYHGAKKRERPDMGYCFPGEWGVKEYWSDYGRF